LRDYLYIPLGGNRGKNADTYRNLLITMILGGLWHGSTWNFVIWGAIHGVALAVERLLPKWQIHPAVRWIATFHIVCFAWIFFRAESFSSAIDVLRAIVISSGPTELSNVLLILVLAAMLLAQFIPDSRSEDVKQWLNRRGVLAQGLAFGAGLVLIDMFGPDGVAPFIYFQF